MSKHRDDVSIQCQTWPAEDIQLVRGMQLPKPLCIQDACLGICEQSEQLCECSHLSRLWGRHLGGFLFPTYCGSQDVHAVRSQFLGIIGALALIYCPSSSEGLLGCRKTPRGVTLRPNVGPLRSQMMSESEDSCRLTRFDLHVHLHSLFLDDAKHQTPSNRS